LRKGQRDEGKKKQKVENSRWCSRRKVKKRQKGKKRKEKKN
jgi:hypothetical protein